MTCTKAYEELSSQLIVSDLGLEEAVECFAYGSFDDFPHPNTKELKLFDGAMQHLQKYAEMVREGSGDMNAKRRKRAAAAGHLESALNALGHLSVKGREKMSKLQVFLIQYITERISALARSLESGGSDEL